MASEIPFAFSAVSVESTAKYIRDMGLNQVDVEAASIAYITATTAGLWFRFDTGNAAPIEGDHYLPENETIVIDNPNMIENFRAISESGTARIAVTLCR